MTAYLFDEWSSRWLGVHKAHNHIDESRSETAEVNIGQVMVPQSLPRFTPDIS